MAHEAKEQVIEIAQYIVDSDGDLWLLFNISLKDNSPVLSRRDATWSDPTRPDCLRRLISFHFISFEYSFTVACKNPPSLHLFGRLQGRL